MSTPPVQTDAHVRRIAERHLAAGRVSVQSVARAGDGGVDTAGAFIYGSTGRHLVVFNRATGYECSCAHGTAALVCGHVMTVELVVHALTPATPYARRTR